ncbi:hypothetical protein EXN66_Car008185 [Channa argus]|uniref:Uncharacterized protein n=1 Tax=Channa argus TaxID=215402 RepID=A0A6G1PQK3_CHAAH|nr:hypothetical protein EXN66_Car008185 [Channa argus]
MSMTTTCCSQWEAHSHIRWLRADRKSKATVSVTVTEEFCLEKHKLHLNAEFCVFQIIQKEELGSQRKETEKSTGSKQLM